MQHYFDYKVLTCCGISKVKLLGTRQDWVKLKEATANLGTYGLDWWAESLCEILDEFIITYDGNPNKAFWNCIYKYSYVGGSGEVPRINGWILNFIPYIRDKPSYYAKRSLKVCMEECEKTGKVRGM